MEDEIKLPRYVLCDYEKNKILCADDSLLIIGKHLNNKNLEDALNNKIDKTTNLLKEFNLIKKEVKNMTDEEVEIFTSKLKESPIMDDSNRKDV